MYLCPNYYSTNMQDKVKKKSFFKQFYTGYYSLLFNFICDIINIIKESINNKNVEGIKEEVH